MRKKQLLAMILAGTLVSGMTPSVIFATDEGMAVTIEEGTIETPESGTEEVPQETPQETQPEVLPTEAPGTDTSETPEVPPAEVPGESLAPETEPTQAPEPTEAVQEAPVQGAAATVAPSPQAEDGKLVKNETELVNAISEAPNADASSDAAKIILDENIVLTNTITIPTNKNISLITSGKDITISRGTGMKADMFRVDGILTLESAITKEGTAPGSIHITGYLDGNAADGSIIHVTNGTFGMDSSVTLADNITTKEGGAIYNTEGKVVLVGGNITGNQSECGGGIYSENPVQVQGSVSVSDNTRSDAATPDNIALKGDKAVLNVSNVLEESSVLSVNVIEGKAGKQVVQIAEGVDGLTMESVLKIVKYEGTDFTIDEQGALKSTEPEKPAVKPELKLKSKPKWLSRTSAEFTCSTNVDGWFYADWVVKGEDAPSFDVSKEGTPVKANEEFKVTVKDLDKKNPITVYVLIKSQEEKLSKKRYINLDEKTRPGNVTPSPEVSPSITPEASPTPTPGPTHTPVMPSVKDSVVHGLENPLEMWPGVFYNFSVTGAGSDNQNPGEGDAQWVPQYWTQEGSSSKQTTWKIGSSKGIFDEKTLPIRIYLKKYVYHAEKKQWLGTDEIDYISTEVKTAKLSPSGTPGAPGNGEDVLVTDPNASDTGSTSSASGAKTADESPIGNMFMLAAASVLAGGYVLVRRRKKENE